VKIIVTETTVDLYERAALLFQKTIFQSVTKRGQALAVFSGGSTPSGLFQLLAKPPYVELIPWQFIHIFWADERCVPSDHPESNYGQAKKMLLDLVPVPGEHIHPIDGSLTPQVAAEQYQETVLRFTAKGQLIPRFDWVLLGMGNDGHTASIFPGQPFALTKEDLIRPVEANYENRPAMRVTMTELLLNQAREILFLLQGLSKAEIVQHILQGGTDTSLYPAQRIHPVAGKVTWLMDKEAASALK